MSTAEKAAEFARVGTAKAKVDGVLLAAALMRLRNELIQPTPPPSKATQPGESLPFAAGGDLSGAA